MVKVRRFAGLLAIAVSALCSGGALGQGAFPDRPLRLVVPFPPGGSTDIVARVVAGRMADGIGKAVIIDNKPGAAGNVATAEVAKVAADGYTLLCTNSGLLQASLFQPANSPLQLADLTPVFMLGIMDGVLSVHSAVPARTLVASRNTSFM